MLDQGSVMILVETSSRDRVVVWCEVDMLSSLLKSGSHHKYILMAASAPIHKGARKQKRKRTPREMSERGDSHLMARS